MRINICKMQQLEPITYRVECTQPTIFVKLLEGTLRHWLQAGDVETLNGEPLECTLKHWLQAGDEETLNGEPLEVALKHWSQAEEVATLLNGKYNSKFLYFIRVSFLSIFPLFSSPSIGVLEKTHLYEFNIFYSHSSRNLIISLFWDQLCLGFQCYEINTIIKYYIVGMWQNSC